MTPGPDTPAAESAPAIHGAAVDALGRAAAVVVHHRNFPEVVGTIERIVDSGIAATRVIVMDNSEDAETFTQLQSAVPDGVRVRSVENKGYGHAVNAATREFAAGDDVPDFILVSTHETRPESGAIAALVRVLDADSTVGAVGPTLVTDEDGKRIVWSRGGRLTRVLNEPRHFGEREAWDARIAASAPARRHWVDGAFVAYRFDALQALQIREDFFLYFEETDLHARLRGAGHLVVWVPEAIVWQSSGGTPPFYLGRNLQRFQQAHGTALQRTITVPYVMLRAGVRKLVRGGREHQRREMLRGWWQA